MLNSVLESFFNGNGENHSDNDASSHRKKWTHDDATRLASKHPPGCHGITFLPYLTPGERTPDWPHASGAILGLTASNMSAAIATTTIDSNTTPVANPMAGLLYRAAMEGITYLLAEAVSSMQDACGEDGFQPNCLLVVGGGSRNPLWRQMLADVLGLELRFPKESDSAALGAAFQVGAAVTAAVRNEDEKSRVMETYMSKQSLEMEEEAVRPTSDERVLQLYRDGRRRYCESSARLFG